MILISRNGNKITDISWDYSKLAQSYKYSPEYSEKIIKKIIEVSLLSKKSTICDIGAGVGHLTIPLAKLGYSVVAIEPNIEMRKHGKERTKKFNLRKSNILKKKNLICSLLKISYIKYTVFKTRLLSTIYHQIKF